MHGYATQARGPSFCMEYAVWHHLLSYSCIRKPLFAADLCLLHYLLEEANADILLVRIWKIDTQLTSCSVLSGPQRLRS